MGLLVGFHLARAARRIGRWIGPAIALAGLSACTSVLAPQEIPNRYFILSSTTASPPSSPGRISSPATSTALPTLGLGPVEFPGYLDRSEMVIREAPNRLHVSEVDRWAEPLKSNFVQLLAQDLTSTTGGEQVSIFPWLLSAVPTYQITLEVSRFEVDSQGQATLSASWVIRNTASGRKLYETTSNITEPATAGDSAQAAAALSRTVADLSREIASALNGLATPAARVIHRSLFSGPRSYAHAMVAGIDL